MTYAPNAANKMPGPLAYPSQCASVIEGDAAWKYGAEMTGHTTGTTLEPRATEEHNETRAGEGPRGLYTHRPTSRRNYQHGEDVIPTAPGTRAPYVWALFHIHEDVPSAEKPKVGPT